LPSPKKGGAKSTSDKKGGTGKLQKARKLEKKTKKNAPPLHQVPQEGGRTQKRRRGRGERTYREWAKRASKMCAEWVGHLSGRTKAGVNAIIGKKRSS